MQSETTPGGEATLEALERMRNADLPYEERFDPDFTDHDPAEGQPADGTGIAWFWQQFGESFSDVQHEVLQQITTPTKLITVSDLSATHTGEYLGHAPTGKRFTVRNVQVIGFRDGRASDRWGSTDQLGILQQLGLI